MVASALEKATGDTVSVVGRSVRAVCFLSHGQKCEQWLPKGEYSIRGECWLDSANNVRAVMLYGRERGVGTTWYVSLESAVLLGIPAKEEMATNS